MRKIAATYIFTDSGAFLKNGILVCDNRGSIIDIVENKGALSEEAGLEYYSGILVPGFVNTHCHLELSHLRGKIEEKTGIDGFVGAVKQLRQSNLPTIEKAIEVADRKMSAAGIVAVGDIANSAISLKTKLKSKLFYHTFAESFGFLPAGANNAFNYTKQVCAEFKNNNLPASIVPHSPYSVSKPLFEKIEQNAANEKSILSIHNQESLAEKQFFKDGTGGIANHIQNILGIDISRWQPTGESSLLSVLKYLPANNKLILVHNTYTEKADLEKLKQRRNPRNTYFSLCPNSNLYIENTLPPVSLFRKQKLNICLGTDSLASNQQLSILSEMITLQQHFSDITLYELVTWATLNGAKALGIENRFGSFQKGKNPGINLISGVDFKKMKLTGESKVKRLV